MHVRSRAPSALSLSWLLLSLLVACGGGPPTDLRPQVGEAVRRARPDMFDGERDVAAATVDAVRLAGWQRDELGGAAGGGELQSWRSDFTARLRFAEPIGFVLAQVDGSRIVRVVAAAGDEVAFAGKAHAMRLGGEWQLSAMVDGDPNPYQALWQKAGGDGAVSIGYPVLENGMRVGAQGRGACFQPLSRLQPCVVEGSAEAAELDRRAAERQQRQAAAAAAKRQQEQQQAEQRQQEQQRLAAAAAERQRQAEAEQRQQAEAARRQQLLPLLAPLQGEHGAVVTTDAAAAMGTALLEIEVDPAQLTARGKAIDLREMPFREAPFTATVDLASGLLKLQPQDGETLQFGLFRGAVAARSGHKLEPLGSAVREQVDAVAALGRRLQAAAPAPLAVEVLDAAAAKAREAGLRPAALAGTEFHRGKVAPTLAPLFAGEPGGRKVFSWKGNEVVGIRLAAVQQGSALYLRGGAAQSDNLVVTINGVHRAVVQIIVREGAAVVALPAGLELLDLRFEAQGSVQLRSIGLLPPAQGH